MVVPWEKAFILLSSDAGRDKHGQPLRDGAGVPLQKAIVVETYDEVIRSASAEWKAPAVIVLTAMVEYRKNSRRFSRKGVYKRDGHRCQYCWDPFSAAELTLDHVIPQSRGGKTSWDNIVTACLQCNQKKRDRTPAEAKMEILNWPARPDYATFAQAHDLEHVPAEWAPYIPDAQVMA